MALKRPHKKRMVVVTLASVAMHVLIVVFLFSDFAPSACSPQAFHVVVEENQPRIINAKAIDSSFLKDIEQRKFREEQQRAERARRVHKEKREREERKRAQEQAEIEQRKREKAEQERARLEAEQERKRTREESARRNEEVKRLEIEQRKLEREEEQRRLLEERKRAEEARQKEMREQQAKFERMKRLRLTQKKRYALSLQKHIEQQWTRPPKSVEGGDCKVKVWQDKAGKVLKVQVLECSGDKLYIQSVESAVWKASPLPKSPAEDLFEPQVVITFRRGS